MVTSRTDEFRWDALGVALSSADNEMIQRIIFPESGPSRKQIADGLGVCMSTWITGHRDTDAVPPKHRELAFEKERLRRETGIMCEESEIKN